MIRDVDILSLKMAAIYCPETSINHCHHTLRNNPEEQRPYRPVVLLKTVSVTGNITHKEALQLGGWCLLARSPISSFAQHLLTSIYIN
jgi:hypothetical protein